jgi:hypothetical protein
VSRVAELVHTVLDTTDVRRLAEFYRLLVGLVHRPGDEEPGDDDWLVLTWPDGRRALAFNRVDESEMAPSGCIGTFSTPHSPFPCWRGHLPTVVTVPHAPDGGEAPRTWGTLRISGELVTGRTEPDPVDATARL